MTARRRRGGRELVVPAAHDVLDAPHPASERDLEAWARALGVGAVDRQRVEVVVRHEQPPVTFAPVAESWWRGWRPLIGFFVVIAAVVVVTLFALAFLHAGGPIHLPWDHAGVKR